MAEVPEKPVEVEWAHTLKQGAAPQLPDFQHCSSHAWASPPGNNFFVRGPHYLETKAKVPAGEPLLQPIAFDLIKSSSKISSIMKHPNCRVRAALRAVRESAKLPASGNGITDGEGTQIPFVWAFNLQLPSKENHSLVMYYVSFQSPDKGSLMQRFLDGDDSFRQERLKLLTSIPEGPRIVKLVVGKKGAVSMLGKAANCTYTREEDYMEVDVDLGSSMIARAAFQLCVGLAGLVTADFAIVLEGRCHLELPERIVGAMRLANLDFASAPSLDYPLPRHESVIKEKHEASYSRLWQSSKPAQGGHQAFPANEVVHAKEESGGGS